MSGEIEHATDPGAGPDPEIGDLVGRLSGDEHLDGMTRGRLLGRLARLLSTSARRAGATGLAGGRWLSEVFATVVPRIPIRDLETLRAHHGHVGERLAEALVGAAIRGTTAVGAAAGMLIAVEFTAPPLLLSAPAQLIAETLVVAAIEVKLIAELHEVYGVRIPGGRTAKAGAILASWARQRGIDPMSDGMTTALGTVTKRQLRNRLLRLLGRQTTTLGPFLSGAIAGGALNRMFTRRLADAVRADLRRHAGPRIEPPSPYPAG